MLHFYFGVCESKTAGNATLVELAEYLTDNSWIHVALDKSAAVPGHIGKAAVTRADLYAVNESVGKS